MILKIVDNCNTKYCTHVGGKMKLFDTHAHYNDEKFKEDVDKLLGNMDKENLGGIVIPGYNIESSKTATELAPKYKNVYAAVGIHPSDIEKNEEEINKQIEKIMELAQRDKVVAIGEIGLDYYWVQDNKELQKYAFKKQIELANQLNLPIIIHTRESIQDMIHILRNEIKPNKPSILHCCPLNRELVKEGLKLDFYISFAGPVTYKNSKNADEIIQMVPNDKILIETDSPYLSPEPFRGKRNDSSKVKYIAEKIAKVKQMEIEQIASITYENAKRIFEI